MTYNLNQILQKWPSKALVTSNWLREHGISRQLVDKYKRSGWIEAVDNGVYKRPGDDISWSGTIYTLQELLNLDIHVGGKSALETLGLSHYARREESELVLWKEPSVNLPSWFQRYDSGRKYRINSKKLFTDSEKYLTKRKVEDHTLLISSPERAAIEYVHDIPEHEGFDEGHYIFEGLFSLRPNVVEELLLECSSIKVKRLFLYLAEQSDLAWFSKIDQSKIDIGRGKREIIKGGTLNKKYQIVVPEINREEQ